MRKASEEKKPNGYFEILTAADFVNLIIDRDHRLSEVCAEAVQTKTVIVKRALAACFSDYDAKQRILRQAEAGLLVLVEDAK